MGQGKPQLRPGCRGCLLLGAWGLIGACLGLLIATGATVTWLNTQPDIYRAMGKLIVAPRIANIVDDAYSDVDPRFYATQTEILQGKLLRDRVSKRLAHFQDRHGSLPEYALFAELPKISSIFRVWVDSPNGEFARQFVDTLFDEFLKFKGEQKMGLAGSALQTFAREISEKAKELKIAEDELYQFQKKHPDVLAEGQAESAQRQISELGAQVERLETQIGHLRHRLAHATENAEPQVQRDIESMDRQRDAFQKQLTTLLSQNLTAYEKTTEYQKLTASVERTKKLYDEMVSRLSQINVSIDTTQVNVQVHEPAILFSKPVSPDRRRALLIAAPTGFGLGALGGLAIYGVILAMPLLREKPAPPKLP